MLVMDDGALAVAADPDRDVVHVVDLVQQQSLHTITLRPGDEPGRLVSDADGIVHVVTRRGGAIVDLDPRAGTVLSRRTVCANPRGIALDGATDALHVACAGGMLVSLDASGGPAWRRVRLGSDLRDVLMTREGLMVTRFRDAHLLLLDDDGHIVDEHAPPVLTRSTPASARPIEQLRPNTAWRTIPTPDGDWLMLHQASTLAPLEVHTRETPDLGPSGGGYGSRPEGDGCAAVNPVVTRGEELYFTRSSPLLRETVLAVDIAISTAEHRIAMAVAGRRDGATTSGVVFVDPDSLTTRFDPGCNDPEPVPMDDGHYVAVAFDPQGQLVAQSREPAHLVVSTPWAGGSVTIPLEGESRADTGHDLFHRDAGQGIACATCHPEGGDDGHNWALAGFDERHTPALNVGLGGTEPFHWQGDLEDLHALVHEVHVRRMGGRPLSEERVDALGAYLFSMPPPIPRLAATDPAATRGRALFTAWGCDTCHQGASGSGRPEGVDLGLGFDLQVPALRGVASHPPYMHDGRSADLTAAVVDMLERTRPEHALPTEDAVADMVAYLESR